MKQRSKVTATAAKARRSKSARLKRHGVPKDATRLASHAAGEEGEVTWLSRELREAREQQTAASMCSRSSPALQAMFSRCSQ